MTRPTAPATGPGPVLRCDIAAEQLVLGGCLWDAATLAAVRTVITTPEVFVRPAHQQLYAAVCAAADAGQPTDPAGIWRAIAPNVIPGVDGVYLHDLLQACQVPATAVHYAADLTRLARIRHWQQIAASLLDRANSPDADADELDAYAWAQLEEAVLAHEADANRAATATGRPVQSSTHSRRPGHPAAYAQAALRGEVDRILRATGNHAGRLRVVATAASNLARLVTDQSLTSEVVTDALTSAGRRASLEPAAVAAAVHSRLHRYPIGEPADAASHP